ncbi:unnamed protein product [Somion occarium]|uniref:Fungal-type protein kinase domain-containing protein n=1 Tax=Somion occarium TaxID=3059160 RepID=A0ABP1DT69_9APHY
MFNNFSSNPSSYNETRDELKKEVTGKVVYNVNSIIEHFMRINANTKSEQGGDLPDSRIAQCIAQIGTGDLITLHQIVDDSKQNERAMYGPLENIMNAIGDFFAPQGRAPKRFVQQSGFTHVDEVVQQMAFPPRFPDFLMLPEKLSWLSQKPDKAHLKVSWSTTEALVEVKHSATKGSPFYARQSQQETGVKGIIAQTADYVRLRLSARPFQLYTLAFLIYGAECCIAIYDRYGVLLSPGYKVYERVVGPDGNFDYELSYDFVRILARLTCGLSAEDFGSDPTVELRSGNPQKPPSYSVGYKPSASIIPATPLTGPNARYNTVGSPIWSSLSLLGRGTSVWYVKDPTGVRKKVVMKSAWRAGSRTPESSIYEYLKQTLKNLDGIAAFVEGLDVYLDQQTPMRVQNLRIARFNYPVAGTVAETIPFDEDPVLHRLILASVGKPLWEYETPLDFVQGCIAVVSALERLAAHDILHRDVSPGNVLLAADESPRKNNEGFLSDLEFLYIPGMGDTVDPQPTGKLPEHVARPDGTLHRVDEIRNDDIPQLGRHYIYPQDAKPEPKPQGPPITTLASIAPLSTIWNPSYMCWFTPCTAEHTIALRIQIPGRR